MMSMKKKEQDLELELVLESSCTLAESPNQVQNELWEHIPNSETERHEISIVRQ